MPFEILSTAETTGSAAIMIAVVALAFAATGRRRLEVAAVLALWFAIVIAMGATGALDGQIGVGPPRIAFAVTVPFALLCLAFFRVEAIRTALFAVPLPALVAANMTRILGVDFILLYAADRLPAPFAPSAGWGDLFVGLTALPVAWALARYGSRTRALAAIWNAIGVADLVLAVAFGATSAPGPIQIFSSPPDAVSMTSLPWVLIPAFLVPIYLALHVAIFYRLRRPKPAAAASRTLRAA
jgi:uncharacterized protein (TIGR03382 family)